MIQEALVTKSSWSVASLATLATLATLWHHCGITGNTVLFTQHKWVVWSHQSRAGPESESGEAAHPLQTGGLGSHYEGSARKRVRAGSSPTANWRFGVTLRGLNQKASQERQLTHSKLAVWGHITRAKPESESGQAAHPLQTGGLGSHYEGLTRKQVRRGSSPTPNWRFGVTL